MLPNVKVSVRITLLPNVKVTVLTCLMPIKVTMIIFASLEPVLVTAAEYSWKIDQAAINILKKSQYMYYPASKFHYPASKFQWH
jgi:hypothetical protein